MDRSPDRNRPDVLPMVEAAYAIDASLPAWVQRLLDAAEASVGGGLGGFACVFHANANGTLAIDRSAAAVLPRSTEALNAVFDGLTHAPCGWLSSYLHAGRELARWLITSEADPACQLFYRRHLAWSGVHDGLNLVCMDLDQRGVLLSLGIRSNAPLDAATRTSLARVAPHILAAFRLRMRLQQNAPQASGLAQLTPTERSVVTCAARGLSTKEVAYALGISDATVRVHLMRAARRCGVDSRAALLALGRQAMNEARHSPK